jgi:hypothetical protein
MALQEKRSTGETVKKRALDFPEMPPNQPPEMHEWWKAVREVLERERATRTEDE